MPKKGIYLVPAPSFQATYQEVLPGQMKAIAPSLKALGAEKPSIIQRYAGALEDIKSREAAGISESQLTSSREFGRRGIPLSSGIFETTLGERLRPIRREYAGLLTQTGSEREQALRDLATRIAGVRSGALQSALQSAQSLYGTRYGGYMSALDRAFQSQQAEKNRQAQLRAAAIAAPKPTIFPKPDQQKAQKINYANELKDDIYKWFYDDEVKALGLNYLSFVSSYAPYLSLSQIKSIYTSTAGQIYGPPKESYSQIQKAYEAGKKGGGGGYKVGPSPGGVGMIWD